MKSLVYLAVAAVLLGSAGQAASQQPSLVDVARKEAERRKNVKAPAKVYTNADLPTPKPVSPRTAAEGGAAAASEAEAAAAGQGASEVPRGAPGEPEEATAEPGVTPAAPGAASEPGGADSERATEDDDAVVKVADARERLEGARKIVDELSTRVNELTIAQINEPSYARKQQLLQDRDRLAADLTRAKASLSLELQVLAAAEQEARQAVIRKRGRQ